MKLKGLLIFLSICHDYLLNPLKLTPKEAFSE